MNDDNSNIIKLNGSDGSAIGTYPLSNPSVGFGDLTGFAYQYFVLGRR